jgi:hypothetical protein
LREPTTKAKKAAKVPLKGLNKEFTQRLNKKGSRKWRKDFRKERKEKSRLSKSELLNKNLCVLCVKKTQHVFESFA